MKQGTPHQCFLAAIAVVVALVGSSSAAFADEKNAPAPTLAPITQPSVEGAPGVVAPQAAVPIGSYACTEPGTLRRKWNSYVIGWCTTGMTIDISSASAIQGWQPGWGEGVFQGCAWVSSGEHPLSPSGTYNHDCGTTWFFESYFANVINSAPSDDGALVSILTPGCRRYLNVRPWLTGTSSPYSDVGSLVLGDEFYWRYRTKNNQWVLGRFNRPGVTSVYTWVFVPAGCVSVPAVRSASTTS